MTEIQPDLRTVKVKILRTVVVNGKPEAAGTIHEVPRADGRYLCRWGIAQLVEGDLGLTIK